VEEGFTRTGAGAGFVGEEFDAAAGIGTTRDGSTNVQSTLGMYKKKNGKREGLLWRTLRGEQATGAISATRDLDAIPLTMLSCLDG
jgi:hypothetical protein